MRFPIRLKLLAAFGIDLLLMVALGFFASQQMALMNERASSVAVHTIPSLNSVAALKEQVNAYRVSQLEYMLYTSEADKERSLQRMYEVETRLIGYLNAYRRLINSATEQQRFGEVEQAWQRLVATNHQSFIPDARQNNTGTVRPFYSRMNPLYRDVETAIAGLTAETERQAEASLTVVQSAYLSARSFIMVDTVLALVISAAIGLILSGRIALRLSRLTSAAGKVAAGDFDRTVVVASRDEFGQLATAFNRMIASLREQRSALQVRNAALQASLARQEQLTEDLIRRRQAEQEAHRAQAAAEASSQAKSMFLATMSHELRTPLNAILGYAQIMRLAGKPGANGATGLDVDPLERILAAGRHLTAMINNVLDFSKIEQGAVELSISEFPIVNLVNESVAVIAPLVEQRSNRINVICPPDLGLIMTDAGRLRQILINLLANAAKFTEHGTITLRVWRVAVDEPGLIDPAAPPALAMVFFEVQDTGIGIAREHLARLFQPFSQVDASVTRRYEGTGLGLALSRQLCVALGGDISVVSELGRGSTFTVRLPAGLPATTATYAPLAAAS